MICDLCCRLSLRPDTGGAYFAEEEVDEEEEEEEEEEDGGDSDGDGDGDASVKSEESSEDDDGAMKQEEEKEVSRLRRKELHYLIALRTMGSDAPIILARASTKSAARSCNVAYQVML